MDVPKSGSKKKKVVDNKTQQSQRKDKTKKKTPSDKIKDLEWYADVQLDFLKEKKQPTNSGGQF
jgi:hypothetical protein